MTKIWGIASTKTLAKFCNHLAKRYPGLKGVLNWNELTQERQRKAMALEPVNEVWGIGSRLAQRLNLLDIKTVLDLIDYPLAKLRAYFPVTLIRTVQELKGIEAIDFEDEMQTRQQIVRSRSFASEVYELDPLQSAIAMHAEEAARVLREEHLVCQSVSILIYSNRFKPEAGIHFGYETQVLSQSVNDTTTIRSIATKLVKHAYKKGIGYKKAGVVLQGLEKETNVTPDLLFAEELERKQKLSFVLDKLNDRWGKGTVQSALIKSPKTNWKMKRERLSPAYTTRLADILAV